jgi:hypothetical protein
MIFYQRTASKLPRRSPILVLLNTGCNTGTSQYYLFFLEETGFSCFNDFIKQNKVTQYLQWSDTVILKVNMYLLTISIVFTCNVANILIARFYKLTFCCCLHEWQDEVD